MQNGFSSFQVCDWFEFPYEKFRQWVRHGFIHPSTPARGQGTKAAFTSDDIVCIKLFSTLVDRGFSRAKATIFAESLKDKKMATTHYLLFCFDDQVSDWRLFPFESDEMKLIGAWLNGLDWQTALIFNLEKIRTNVSEIIKRKAVQ